MRTGKRRRLANVTNMMATNGYVVEEVTLPQLAPKKSARPSAPRPTEAPPLPNFSQLYQRLLSQGPMVDVTFYDRFARIPTRPLPSVPTLREIPSIEKTASWIFQTNFIDS